MHNLHKAIKDHADAVRDVQRDPHAVSGKQKQLETKQALDQAVDAAIRDAVDGKALTDAGFGTTAATADPSSPSIRNNPDIDRPAPKSALESPVSITAPANAIDAGKTETAADGKTDAKSEPKAVTTENDRKAGNKSAQMVAGHGGRNARQQGGQIARKRA